MVSVLVVLRSCRKLIPEDTILDLMNETAAVGARIKVKLRLVSEPEKDFMEGVDAEMSRLDGNPILAVVSAQTLSTCIGPLGQALQLIVKFMNGIADVCCHNAPIFTCTLT